jgi:uncharacterized protein (TIGR02145 family)
MKKQSISTITLIFILWLMTSLFNSCIKEEVFAKATVETSQATSITEATAICGGVISADGGSSITAWGICWSTFPNPTIENDTTIAAAGTSVFSSSIKALSPGTTYYVRAYAVNKGGVAYGLNEIFTTKTFSITTTPIAISLVNATSAIGGGNIFSDGDSSSLTVIARGVCWNTFPSPTIENSKTSDGVGGGRFTSNIDSLTAFTTYYVRAYATNGNGTIYGNEVVFTTLNGVIGLTTDAVSLITPYTATCGGTITSDGGATITECGLCWNTSPTPTTANNKNVKGSGTGTFVTDITGLAPGITYYVRSYGINSVGTSYGNEVTFTTQSGVVGLATIATSSITAYTATSGGSISSDGGATVTVRGICWDTSSAPTTANSNTTNGFGTGTFTSSMTGLTPNTTYYVRAYATNSVGTTYGNEMSFTTLASTGTATDIEGNIYNYITIGTQVWMVENLKTTIFNDGTSIPLVSDGTAWTRLTTPGCCFYNNEIANKSTYGTLYNWYAVNTGKLAPTGWHIPTDTEWTTLENYLISNGYNYDGTSSENKIAKSLAATTGWSTSTYTGSIGNDLSKNNKSGFTALPGGYRGFGYGGNFFSVGEFGSWWCFTEEQTTNARTRNLSNEESHIGKWDWDCFCERHGSSVRCIRD